MKTLRTPYEGIAQNSRLTCCWESCISSCSCRRVSVMVCRCSLVTKTPTVPLGASHRNTCRHASPRLVTSVVRSDAVSYRYSAWRRVLGRRRVSSRRIWDGCTNRVRLEDYQMCWTISVDVVTNVIYKSPPTPSAASPVSHIISTYMYNVNSSQVGYAGWSKTFMCHFATVQRTVFSFHVNVQEVLKTFDNIYVYIRCKLA